MLIHICTGCGKVSINRIAADDDAQAVFHVYMNSCEAGAAFRNSLISEGISLLSTRDNDMVQTQLFGCCEFMESSIINQ